MVAARHTSGAPPDGYVHHGFAIAASFGGHRGDLPFSVSVVGVCFAADFQEHRLPALGAQAQLPKHSALHSRVGLRFGVLFVLHDS